jgi:hypothetical protein
VLPKRIGSSDLYFLRKKEYFLADQNRIKIILGGQT